MLIRPHKVSHFLSPLSLHQVSIGTCTDCQHSSAICCPATAEICTSSSIFLKPRHFDSNLLQTAAALFGTKCRCNACTPVVIICSDSLHSVVSLPDYIHLTTVTTTSLQDYRTVRFSIYVGRTVSHEQHFFVK